MCLLNLFFRLWYPSHLNMSTAHCSVFNMQECICMCVYLCMFVVLPVPSADIVWTICVYAYVGEPWIHASANANVTKFHN